MLGFSPISSAPFAALSGGANFDSSVDESASVSEITSTQLVYPNFVSEDAVGDDAIAVAASVFTAVSEEGASASEAVSLLVDFASLIQESAQALGTTSAAATFQGFVSEASSVLDIASATVDFSASINESGTGTDTPSASVVFLASVLESATISDLLSSTSTMFLFIDESAAGQDTVETQVDFAARVNENLVTTDSVLVAPSTFNAAVSEQISAIAQFLASVAFIANIQEGAQAADSLLARFLWELVDDYQNANWNSINDSQSISWSLIAGQSAEWNTINDAQNTEWNQVDDSQPATWNDVPNQF